jgi:hypothetical protein
LTVYASVFFTFLPLYFKVTFVSEPVRLVFPVSPENVASLVRLKIPRRNQNNITLSDPHTPFQLASNSAQTFFAVLTLYHDSFSAKHFNSRAQHIVSTRQQHIFKIPFICDFSFAHLPTPNYVVALAYATHLSIRIIWRKSKTRFIADLTLPLKNSNSYIKIGNRLY